MNKYTLLAIAVASILTGCGGGGSATENTHPITPSLARKAADGYLVNAEVYIDRNQDGVASDDELHPQKTQEEGHFEIAASDAKYPVIIRAKAGESYDSDKAGFITQSFELIAEPGQTVISPYTTLAKVNNLSLEALAAELNLETEVISGDYIKLKQQPASKAAAQKAHLVARSLTQQLPDSILKATNQKDLLIGNSKKIITKADLIINQAPNSIDDKVLKLDKQGDFIEESMPPSIQQALVGKQFFATSTNQYYFKEEGLTKVKFDNSQVTITNDAGKTLAPETIQYSSKGYRSTNGDIDEKVYYASDTLSLVITKENDLQLLSTLDFSEGYQKQDFTRDQLVGKTWYYFFDSSNTKNAHVVDATFTFEQDGKVTVGSVGDKFAPTISNWSIENGTLVIAQHDDWKEDKRINMTNLTSNQLSLVYLGNSNLSLPKFMTTNEAMAKALLQEWH